MPKGLEGATYVTGDGSLSLHNERYDQLYHSLHGAQRESRHVFLASAGIGERLRRDRHARVLEVGFGTGLNALVTADAALAAGAELDFVSLEHEPLGADVLRSLGHAQWLERPELAEELYRELERGATRISLGPGVRIELRLGEALEAELPPGHFHAVYHDAFSPEANPELWTEAAFRKLRATLVEGGHLTTYSAKGTVRRTLDAAGFQVERLPGPPGKRHMTRGTA